MSGFVNNGIFKYMRETDRKRLYSDIPVRSAVLTLIVPAVISQLVTIVYNLADVYFVGQLGDPELVAAVSLAAPLFTILSAMGNLFGMGGSSAISRALGRGDEEGARKVAVFCFWSALGLAAAAALLGSISCGSVLRALGAGEAIFGYARDYTLIAVMLGGTPAVLSSALAQMVRADGGARQAGFGLSMGGILNIILDPILIFGFGMGVVGAAAATAFSNTMALIYFLTYLYRQRDRTILKIRLRSYTLDPATVKSVFSSGIPAALHSLLISLFYMLLNHRAAGYSDIALASLGIVQKLDILPQYVTVGIAQGIVPLIGFCWGAGDKSRMRRVYAFALSIALAFSAVCIIIFEIFAPSLILIFINDAATVSLGSEALRVMCLTVLPMAVCNITTYVFQATGNIRQSITVDLIRRLLLSAVLLFILDGLFPLTGIFMTSPATDFLSAAFCIVLYRRLIGRSAASGAADAE